MSESEYQYKVINKALMIERDSSRCAWRVTANIFEVVKAFLLWNYPKDLLPLFVPYYDVYRLPDLDKWYQALSKPNSPWRVDLKVSPEEYRSWILALDLSKPFDKAACDARFEIVQGVVPKREVDAIEIAENENREET